MAGFLAAGPGFDQLPPHSGCGWVGRHIDMHQFAMAVSDEHQDVQPLECQCRDGQEISGPEMVSMIAQECAPVLRR
jgi:hypothetical protein